jgi:hypothetical protein
MVENLFFLFRKILGMFGEKIKYLEKAFGRPQVDVVRLFFCFVDFVQKL